MVQYLLVQVMRWISLCMVWQRYINKQSELETHAGVLCLSLVKVKLSSASSKGATDSDVFWAFFDSSSGLLSGNWIGEPSPLKLRSAWLPLPPRLGICIAVFLADLYLIILAILRLTG